MYKKIYSVCVADTWLKISLKLTLPRS